LDHIFETTREIKIVFNEREEGRFAAGGEKRSGKIAGMVEWIVGCRNKAENGGRRKD
jgi:hypothetical protein